MGYCVNQAKIPARRVGVAAILVAAMGLSCPLVYAQSSSSGSSSSSSENGSNGSGSSSLGPSAPTPASSSTYQGSIVTTQATTDTMPLSLEQAIALALQHNLGLIVSQTNESTAGGQRLQQLQNLLPTITAASGSRTRKPISRRRAWISPVFRRSSDRVWLPGCARVDDLVAAEYFIAAEIPGLEA